MTKAKEKQLVKMDFIINEAKELWYHAEQNVERIIRRYDKIKTKEQQELIDIANRNAKASKLHYEMTVKIKEKFQTEGV